jgi:fibronectin type 3 domain-containing protein
MVTAIVPVDTSAPSTPQNVITTAVGQNSIDLSWDSSVDNESGVTHYIIYRDTAQVGQSTTTVFADSNLADGTTYDYEISAVNGEGLESSLSAILSVATVADTVPPSVASITAPSATQVVVTFSEAVEEVSATTISNYTINNGVTISNASLGGDLKTVTLSTSALTGGTTYSFTVINVTDRATSPNVINALSFGN